MFVIVAMVVVGVIFIVGELCGLSVAQTQAGDRARRDARDRRHSSVRLGEVVTQP